MELLVTRYNFLLPLFLLITAHSFLPQVISGDLEALLSLKSSIDTSNSLQWQGTDFCNWQGVKECMNGRVIKLVLEHLNLTGILDEKIISQLDQLRVLSFKGNSLNGQIPNLSKLLNLKSLYLNENDFSGTFPESLTTLHRLKIIVLSKNNLSGQMPPSLVKLRRLYTLYLEDNRFTGRIPPLNQQSLRFLNVSNNELSGKIPSTPALNQFNTSSFSGNLDLCGGQVNTVCDSNNPGPALSPAFPSIPEGKESSSNKGRLIKIIAGTVGGFLVLLICMLLIWIACKGKKKKNKEKSLEFETKSKEDVGAEHSETSGPSGIGGNNVEKQGVFSWENEGLGHLVFLGAGDQQMSYSLEDLLKASAETLGRGTIGSTYKAVMESGFIVTVKRLKDARYPRLEEFRRHVDLLGRLRHSNLVPLRAYFQAKEERLLVYDYFPNGSLFSLIHGSRAAGSGKPLHWTSCLKIAEDLAAGLFYIHQNPGLTHGNLKSSNVLFGPDFESCLTDYGLSSFHNPDSLEEQSATSLFYKAPECRDVRKPSTQPADVYSFGVLLLELLTGKTPFQDLVQEHGSDIPRWVRSVREEETESGDEPTSSTDANDDKLQALLSIAMACVALSPENRPAMRDVLKMIRDARAEAQGSSNSSDHSPGRWSDTIQSLPREEHSSI